MDTPPTWDWSSVGDTSSHQPRPEANSETTQRRRQAEHAEQPGQAEHPAQPEQPAPRTAPNGRRYGPRTCRICFDTEDPKFPPETASTFGIPASNRPIYCSDDPEVGRLLSPCKCNGSQKYVHEGCLMAWRLANPTEARNYWQCPTCKFTYKLSRLHWATALSSKWAQVSLTLLILLIGIFFLGFVADPLFDLWSDPIGTIGETVTSVVSDIEGLMPPPYEEPVSWTEHFLKGFFSLGIVGLIKSMFAMSPWHWWNIRSTGIATGRRQGTGRARVENISLIFVLLGAFTFMMSIWKVVKALSARVLSKISDKVVDVGEDDDDDIANEE